MLRIDQINEIHRLAGGEHWLMRRIARQLRLAARTVKKYLQAPVPSPIHRPRPSKLDPFKPLVAELLQQDPRAPGVVILQRLRAAGYAGGHTILDGYLQRVRPSRSTPRAFLRMEPSPGERFEIDWGRRRRTRWPPGALPAALPGVRSPIRFLPPGLPAVGRPAIRARAGKKVRWRRAASLFFAPTFGRSALPTAGRSFPDLAEVNHQVRQWLDEVANVRLHRETRQRPCDRFRPDALRPLPALAPDYRDTAQVFVYKDLRWHFDANRYYAPPRFIGHHLIAKADSSSLTLYDRQGAEIVRYPRCGRRGQTLGAGRFEKELLEHRPAARCSQAQQRLRALLDGLSPQETLEAYLRGLADSDRSLLRQLQELLALFRAYRPQQVAEALQKALAARAFGADYVAHLLHQIESPREPQPPLQLRDPQLNQLTTDPLSLLDYDAFILKARKESADDPGRETDSTPPDQHAPKAGDDNPGGGQEKS